MNKADLNNKSTYCASESLVDDMNAALRTIRNNGDDDTIINVAYTDYGGTFFDKVLIEFFKGNFPNSILFESTSWNGQNAFIFGELAAELWEYHEKGNAFAFDGLGDFYFNLENSLIVDGIANFLKYKGYTEQDEDYQEAMDTIKESYSYGIEPNYLDYDDTEFIRALQENNLPTNKNN